MSDRGGDSQRAAELDVLVVGAGPTGLTLSAQLQSFGVRFRVVDRALDRARESRALAVQARSLEILQSFGLGNALVRRGNSSATVTMHIEGRLTARVRLGDFEAIDTRYPYILFVSQAETEALLGAYLSARGVTIERGVELVDFADDGAGVRCVVRHGGGGEEQVRARYLVGCDGAHSTVRKLAGIAFEGDAYLQDFMLGDVEADASADTSLETNSLHSFAGRGGIAMFFPLGQPTTWRVIAMSKSATERVRRERPAPEQSIAADLSLAELQEVVDGVTGGGIRLRDPAWLTHFRLHHRQAVQYRRGRVFLAGDAGHIHSPVGAQGMNTGIQDAWNLGWKLALVAQGHAHERLLDSYASERWPVGRKLLRYTDRVFTVFVRSMSANIFASWLRRIVAARILPAVLDSRRLRTFAFRFISELDIRYRKSPIARESAPRLRAGPRAGDRLPDARVLRHGQTTFLQQELVGARFHLLLCGAPASFAGARISEIAERYRGHVAVSYLTRHEEPGALVDSYDEAFRRLGITDAAQYLIRPDGYVAFRCAGHDLSGLLDYLPQWLRDSA